MSVKAVYVIEHRYPGGRWHVHDHESNERMACWKARATAGRHDIKTRVTRLVPDSKWATRQYEPRNYAPSSVTFAVRDA